MRKRSSRRTAANYDAAWKEALEWLFPLFILFFFPDIHDEIDWSRAYEFLDKELQQARPRGRKGGRVVDALVKVWRRDGVEAWVLIHIEIQNREQAQFSERMFVYSYRLFDRHGRLSVSLAVLGDGNPEWRPVGFEAEMWGSSIQHRFRIVKLVDYESRLEMLETSDNPFAVVVMIHLRAMATTGKPLSRLQWKLTIAKGLYERGWPEDYVVALLRFLDWTMALSPAMEQRFDREMENYEEEKKMPRMAPFEVRAMERGMLQKGRQDVLRVLDVHFGETPQDVRDAVNRIESVDRLDALLDDALRAASLEEFEKRLRA